MFELVDETMTVRPNRTMFPPIWVAACDSQRRRNDGLRKTASAPSAAGGAGAAVRCRRSAPGHRSRSGARPSDGRIDRGGHRHVPALDEGGESALERRSLQQHVASAGLTTQADVGTEAIHEPGVAAARVGSTKPQHVTEQQGQGRAGTADRLSEPWVAMARDEVAPGRRHVHSVEWRDLHDNVGLGRGELRDDAAGARQRPGQLVRCPDGPDSSNESAS